MTDAERKTLTLYLGECWHERASNYYPLCCMCGITIPINKDTGNIIRRTFTTIADLHAVYSRMVERGEWEEFLKFAAEVSAGFFINYADKSGEIQFYGFRFISWLFCLNCPDQIEERMRMAAEWIARKALEEEV